MLFLPFQLLRVLDFTISPAGAWATRYFGDFGAEVIKIERPGTPASAEVPPDLQCNKLSCILDYTQPEGRDLCQRLVQQAEIVFVDAEKAIAGLDYETLAELRPRLVFVLIKNGGYVEAGPAAAAAAVAALFHFRATGDGQQVEVDGEQVLLNLRGDWVLATAAGIEQAPSVGSPDPSQHEQDPRLQARGFFEPVSTPEAGEQLMRGVPFKFSRTPGHVRLPPPRPGEHNDYVLGQLLGAKQSLRVAGEAVVERR